MKKTRSFKTILVIAVAILFISAANPARNRYLLTKDSTVTILGTSNLHNWNETVSTVLGDGSVTWNTDGSFDLDEINLKMEVNSIKSDMGSIMNNNTYKALKSDKYPEIIFTLTIPVASIKAGAASTTISAKGTLFIAGVNKSIDMQVKVAAPNQGYLTFEGSKTVKMSDYGISPPTALLGTLRTGDEITINFKTIFTITSN
ncbi:MAG TPA: YceI family protein [Bacteroidia bacterium]|nr:YceI family protein [Bacteroidia bacterium]